MSILKEVEKTFIRTRQDMCTDIAQYMEHEYVVKTPESLIIGAVRRDGGCPHWTMESYCTRCMVRSHCGRKGSHCTFYKLYAIPSAICGLDERT